MTKLPKGVVRKFVIKKISLDRGHRHRTVRVLLFDTQRNLGRYYKDCGFKGPKEITGGFCRNKGRGPSIGDICLMCSSPKFLYIVMHESLHAAFHLSRLCHKLYVGEEEIEEFIVTAGEYITQKVVRGVLTP